MAIRIFIWCWHVRRKVQDARGCRYYLRQNNGGVTVRRIENKMGIKGAPTCELVFKMPRPNWWGHVVWVC